MKDMTLLVMAAGMGSRYGGLKQLDAVGPNGETIIDFSVYDAIRAGYNKVVFIIRKDFEKQFKQKISNKYKNKIDVEIVYQDLNDLPGSFRCPNERSKPWGTGHAILAARNAISEPFVLLMSAIITFAPTLLSILTVANPMPLAPPVTTAVCPSRKKLF